MNEIVEKIKQKAVNLKDVYFRKITYEDKVVHLIFSEAMVDTQLVSKKY